MMAGKKEEGTLILFEEDVEEFVWLVVVQFIEIYRLVVYGVKVDK